MNGLGEYLLADCLSAIEFQIELLDMERNVLVGPHEWIRVSRGQILDWHPPGPVTMEAALLVELEIQAKVAILLLARLHVGAGLLGQTARAPGVVVEASQAQLEGGAHADQIELLIVVIDNVMVNKKEL